MSWIKENCVSFFQLFCINVLKTGRVPQHLAFIMDGNRRYAKKTSVRTATGHDKGFGKLSETIKWLLLLGVPEVTVYAFSIENFKRGTEEVSALMNLARYKFEGLLEDLDQINQYGVRVHIVGRLSLLPEDLRILMAKVMLATRHNDKLRLNIAYSYTGRDEISRAASQIIDGVKNNEIMPNDIDENLVLQTLDLGEADLVVRTSGEVRLSDFMLGQVSNAVLYFSDVLWPEFSVWNLVAAFIHYQRYAPPPKEKQHVSDIKQQFLNKIEAQRWQELEKLVSCRYIVI